MDRIRPDDPCPSFRVFEDGTHAPYKDLAEPRDLAEHVVSLVAFNPPSLNTYAVVAFGQEPQPLPRALVAGSTTWSLWSRYGDAWTCAKRAEFQGPPGFDPTTHEDGDTLVQVFAAREVVSIAWVIDELAELEGPHEIRLVPPMPALSAHQAIHIHAMAHTT